MLERSDPFFVQKVTPGEEITLDLKQEKKEKPFLVECIVCRQEFNPNSRKQKSIPSVNYCSKCYSVEV